MQHRVGSLNLTLFREFLADWHLDQKCAIAASSVLSATGLNVEEFDGSLKSCSLYSAILAGYGHVLVLLAVTLANVMPPNLPYEGAIRSYRESN